MASIGQPIPAYAGTAEGRESRSPSPEDREIPEEDCNSPGSERLVQIESQDPIEKKIWAKYLFRKVIGKGGFSIVISLQDKKYSKQVATKVVDKTKLSPDTLKLLQEEPHILGSLSHPSIIPLYDCVESQKRIFMFLEHMEGGDLSKYIKERRKACDFFSETETQTIMIRLMSALNYMHAQGVVHRDIKPGNMLMKDKGKLEGIKLSDFGLSIRYKTRAAQNSKQKCGTLSYMAPELIREGTTQEMRISPAVDIWAAGVVMGILLNNNAHPYIDKGESEKHIKEKVARADIDLTKIKCSTLAMDLLKKLLNPNPTQRIKAADAILHPWLKPNIEDVLLRDLKSASVGRNSTVYSGLVGSSMTASTQTTLPASPEGEISLQKQSNLYNRIRQRQRSFDPKAAQAAKIEIYKQTEPVQVPTQNALEAMKTSLRALLLVAHLHASEEGPAAKPISLKLRMISKYKKHPRSPLKGSKLEKIDEQSAKLAQAANKQTYSNVLCSPLMTQVTLDALPGKSRKSSKNNIVNDSFERSPERWQENSLEVVDIPAEQIGYPAFDLKDCEEELNREPAIQKQISVSRKGSPLKIYSNASNQVITTQHGMVIRKNVGHHPVNLGIGTRKETILSRGTEGPANQKLEYLQTSLERKYQQSVEGNQNSKLYRVFGKEPGPYSRNWGMNKVGEPSSQSTEASPVLMSKTRTGSIETDRGRNKIKVVNHLNHDPKTSPVLMSTMNISPTDSTKFVIDLKQELGGNRVFNTDNQIGSRVREPTVSSTQNPSKGSPVMLQSLKPVRKAEVPNVRRDDGMFRLNREIGSKPALSRPRPQEAFKQKLQSLHHSIEDSKKLEERRKSHYLGQMRGSAYDYPNVRSGVNSSMYSKSQNKHPTLNVSNYSSKNT